MSQVYGAALADKIAAERPETLEAGDLRIGTPDEDTSVSMWDGHQWQPLRPQAVIDTITVNEDIGGPYPLIKHVTLDLLADGTVRWRDLGVGE